MTFQKIIVFVSVFLCTSLPVFAADSRSDTIHQVKFNLGVLDMRHDASVFLHSLALIRDNDSEEVLNFLEYKLDIIVCEASEMRAGMNPTQEKWTKEFLRQIKEYRQKNPRAVGMVIDPQKFSKDYEPFNASYAQRADEILASLK